MQFHDTRAGDSGRARHATSAAPTFETARSHGSPRPFEANLAVLCSTRLRPVRRGRWSHFALAVSRPRHLLFSQGRAKQRGVLPGDGTVCIVNRAHSWAAGSVNPLRHRDAIASVLLKRELREQRVFGAACGPRTGTVWVSSLQSSFVRFTDRGDDLSPLSIKASAASVTPITDRV